MSFIVSEQSQQVTAKQIFESPSIWILHNFLSEAECNHFISTAEHKMMPSTTVDPNTGEFIVVEARTSTVTFFTLYQDPIVTGVEDRIAALTNIPVVNGEGLQVLRYKIGQEYKPHYDFFDPANAGSHVPMAKGGQRVATILMYLSDVEEGGETIFPRLDYSFHPSKGDALMFYNLDQFGKPHFDTLHGSVPVARGVKWVSTKWIREREYR